MALQIDWISDLLQNLNHGQQQLAAGDASVRMCMLQWAWNLAHALENPYGGIMRMLMVDVSSVLRLLPKILILANKSTMRVDRPPRKLLFN